jgi:hypothetical protein
MNNDRMGYMRCYVEYDTGPVINHIHMSIATHVMETYDVVSDEYRILYQRMTVDLPIAYTFKQNKIGKEGYMGNGVFDDDATDSHTDFMVDCPQRKMNYLR